MTKEKKGDETKGKKRKCARQENKGNRIRKKNDKKDKFNAEK